MFRPSLFVLLLALGCLPARAAIEPSLPQITVEGDRTVVKTHALHYVVHVARPSSLSGPLARWHSPVCPLVAGLPRAMGEAMLENLSSAIQASGARLGPPECHANLLVIVTQDPAALIKKWVSRDPSLFAKASPSAIQRLEANKDPVRVLYNEDIGPAGGAKGSTFVVQNHQFNSIEAVGASRITGNVMVDLASVVVIVDPRTLQGIPLSALSDYVAFVGLAEINPDADLQGLESILNLFHSPAAAPPTTMSAWDKSYLSALYHAQENTVMQTDVIIDSMAREIAPAP
jgi:hypothetical protein